MQLHGAERIFKVCKNIPNTYAEAHTANKGGLLFFLEVQSEELHFTDTTSANDFCLVHFYPSIHIGHMMLLSKWFKH